MSTTSLIDKYLLPWIEVKMDFMGGIIGQNSPLAECYRRPRLIRPKPEPDWFAVFRHRGEVLWAHYSHYGDTVGGLITGYSTAQQAMWVYDKALLERGYVFLTEEQAARLETLA